MLDAASRAAFPGVDLQATDAASFVKLTAGEDVLVAEWCGTIAGFSSVWAEETFLHHFHVLPALHRTGIGRALMHRTLERHGAEMSLKCTETNHPARAFYRALGWIETDEPGGCDPLTGPWLWIRTPQAATRRGCA